MEEKKQESGNAQLKKSIYSIFSDKVMIILAVMAVPVIAADFLLKQGSLGYWISFGLGWLIWLLFLLEFTLKLYVEENKSKYIGEHKLDSAISIVIIFSPLLGLISANITSFAALRLVRISRIFSATRVSTVARSTAYAGTAAVKGNDQNAKEGSFTITRLELRHILTALGASERDINLLMTSLDKTHRHTNIIVFVNLLEKLGIGRDKMSNVLRRMGMDDVTIIHVFRMVDESRIRAETGRLYEVKLDYT
jgi:hypothetical protein